MDTAQVAKPKTGNVARGIFYMLISTIAASCMNSAARYVSQSIHPFEVVFFRNLAAFLFVLPMLMRVGFGALRTNRIGTHVGRATLNVVNMLVWFTAVSLAPLSEVVALGFTAPIFATVLSMLVFREIVGWRRWSAILVGFSGTMVILQPGFDTITLGQGLTLLAVVMWAGCILIIKSQSRTESSIAIVAYMSILMTPMSLIPALFVWQWPTAMQLFWLVTVGVCGGITQYMLAQAFHEADIGVVMPFDFMKLVWVGIIAYVAFGEVPTLATCIGGVIIFASGIYIARRETLAQRAKS